MFSSDVALTVLKKIGLKIPAAVDMLTNIYKWVILVCPVYLFIIYVCRRSVKDYLCRL